ncbi:MAG: exopolyphosphatase [Candidatus Riflebacteria bacterium]|nr:exopolyphosphatase [Candidatus Riflebacteria bacterium]
MRLITRGDADGLCCAVFLRIMESIDSIEFVHPKDMQDGKVMVTTNDIIANLPYHPDCGMWFDHHASSEKDANKPFKGKFKIAPSAARVIFEHYDCSELKPFLDLLEATDMLDSAQLSIPDVTDPKDYILLFYTLDPRSGLGPFKDYFLKLMDWIIFKPISEILEIPEVKKRCTDLFQQQKEFEKLMRETSRVEGKVIFTDLRKTPKVPAGNRFLIFTIFPEGSVQVRVFNGKGGEFTVIAIGHSIFNRTCQVDVGALCNQYGGGGHKGAATCQVANQDADKIVKEIIKQLNG